MSGHSKWSQIKHKKGVTDQKRSQLFSKLSKALTVAARNGADPSTNIALQSAIDQARAANVPKENIERAIKRAADKQAAALEPITLHIIGPANIAIVVEAITDNRNRTLGELKTLVARHNAKIAAEGSLGWLFTSHGAIHLPTPETSTADTVEMALIEAGAQDIEKSDDEWVVLVEPQQLGATTKHLTEKGFTIVNASLELRASQFAEQPDAQTMERVETLLETLDSHDDTQALYTNLP